MKPSTMVLALLAVSHVLSASLADNLISNGDFQDGQTGQLPTGWEFKSAHPALSPTFELAQVDGRRMLTATGGGNPDCVGYLRTEVPVTLGKTYLFRVVFRMSADLNPHQHLLFQCFRAGTKDGIFKFKRLHGEWVEGSAKIHYPGEGSGTAQARILFRLSAHGRVWVKEISLAETDPVTPRWVRVACTAGKTDLQSATGVLDAVGAAGADLVLLTEYMAGGFNPEPVPGPSSRLMSEKARKYGMYVAGSIVRQEKDPHRLYNTALLFDRQGKLVGTYDKLHPYSPELNEQGITPGTRVPVFKTDFGTVGFIICYDSWFTDVVELLSLKGADLVLFPNAGYYRSLMPARASDNCVRLVASSWSDGYGVWDTVGREVLTPDADPRHTRAAGITFKDIAQSEVGPIKVLTVSLDLNRSPSPAYNGGTMYSAPGGKRSRHEQKAYLDDQIKEARDRWWVE